MNHDEGECDMLIEQRGMLCRTGQELCVFDKRARYFLAVSVKTNRRNRMVGRRLFMPKKSKCDGTSHLRGIKKRMTNPTEAGRSSKGVQ